jgi:phage host-nuclease inhibitor protein Gam
MVTRDADKERRKDVNDWYLNIKTEIDLKEDVARVKSEAEEEVNEYSSYYLVQGSNLKDCKINKLEIRIKEGPFYRLSKVMEW